MNHTVLMRLSGPMQSWGVESRFSIRDTAREPTKSGVLGLVCAALGRSRELPIVDLNQLRMAVRVDREGTFRRDYHTAQEIAVADSSDGQLKKGKPKLKNTELSDRHYLADAWFTVGLSGEDPTLLRAIDEALGAPHWPLALGRKSFTPGLPVRIVETEGRPLGVCEGNALEVLNVFRDPYMRKEAGPVPRYRFVFDAELPHERFTVVQERTQPDTPISFLSREFLPRRVVVAYAESTTPALTSTIEQL